jgi:hypothetical protein
MQYTVKWHHTGFTTVEADSPQQAAERWIAFSATGGEILDIIPETCEDCTRAARHAHGDDVHESYWRDDEQA